MSIKDDAITKFNYSNEYIDFLVFSNKAYHVSYIKKKNGKLRKLYIPCKNLKLLQEYLLSIIKKNYKQSYYLRNQYAFLEGKDNIKYAKNHINRKYVFKYDVEDYFDKITFPRIFGALKKNGFSEDDSLFISQIACYRFVNKHVALAQGSPISPILSNIVSTSIDKFFFNFIANIDDVVYSRYADDITLSTNQANSATIIKEKLQYICEKLEKINFKLNAKKYKELIHGNKTVGGIVVNEKSNLSREFINVIKLNLYYAKKNFERTRDTYCDIHGTKMKTTNKDNYFEMSIRGKINYLTNVRGKNDDLAIKLKRKYNSIENFKHKYDLRKEYEDSIYTLYIKENSNGNETSTAHGTIFRIKEGLVTCYHNLYDYINKNSCCDGFSLLVKDENEFYNTYNFRISPKELRDKIFNYEVNYGVIIDKDNDIIFLPTKLLADFMDNYSQFDEKSKCLKIYRNKDFYLSSKENVIVQAFGYCNEKELASKEFSARYDSKYKKLYLNDYLGDGASGGPCFYKNSVVGMYNKGTDEYQKGECISISTIINKI